MTLPSSVSASSGLDAVAHPVEAVDAIPVVSLMAEEGVRALVAALRRVVLCGTDLPTRQEAQYRAWLCDAALRSTTMSLHHMLYHVLGEALRLPHAPSHAVVVPHAPACNAGAAPAAVSVLSRALGDTDAARALRELAGRTRRTPVLRRSGSDGR